MSETTGRPRSKMRKADVLRDNDYADQIHASGAGMFAMRLFGEFKNKSMLEAIRHFDEFIDEHPNNMLARAMRCECRIANNYQLEEAAIEARLILEKEPGRARLQYVLGRALVMLQRWSEAVEPLEHYLKSERHDLSTLMMLSLCYLEGRKDYAKALRIARQTVRLAPDDDRTHELIINVFKGKGDEAAARRYANQLMDYKPQIVNKLISRPGREEEAALLYFTKHLM